MNGKPTATFTNYKESLSHVVRWYGQSSVSEFGPLALQFIRDKLVDAGHVRKTVNDRFSCIVCFFQWLSSFRTIAGIFFSSDARIFSPTTSSFSRTTRTFSATAG